MSAGHFGQSVCDSASSRPGRCRSEISVTKINGRVVTFLWRNSEYTATLRISVVVSHRVIKLRDVECGSSSGHCSSQGVGSQRVIIV